MIFPFCKEKMDTGYLKSSKFMQWGKEKTLGFLPNDLKLNKKQFMQGFFEGFYVKSYHCGICNKIIISLDDLQTD